MVSSALVDAIADPHRVLIDLFDGDLASFPHVVATYFSNLFSSTTLLDELPVLHIAHPPQGHKNHSIVRFRAMVQDTSLAEEIFLARRPDGSCGGWGLGELDDISIDEVDYENLRNRHVIWAVSIPGESQWCSSATDAQSGDIHDLSSESPKYARPHKFPVPGAPHVGAQVKIYNMPQEMYKATDVVEFVGILSFEPDSTEPERISSMFVPTLHVLFSKTLPMTLTSWDFPAVDASRAGELRQELISWVAEEALAGDKLAAEWILLCAIARVQAKQHRILPPPVTLCRFPSPTSSSSPIPTISHVLALIFPLLTTIPISLPVLNGTNFYPQSKDEDLHSGWLQLPRGTICVITEGGIDEGELNGQALLNIHTVQEALECQTLQYIFPYSRFTFDTDLCFILLSDGRKSTFFQTHFNVPFHPVNTTMNELEKKLYKPYKEIVMPSREKLKEFRQLVCGAKMGTSGVDQHIAQRIQADFIEERQRATGNHIERIGPIDLMYRILLARLYALSLHQAEVSFLIWESVKLMEVERRARLALP